MKSFAFAFALLAVAHASEAPVSAAEILARAPIAVTAPTAVAAVTVKARHFNGSRRRHHGRHMMHDGKSQDGKSNNDQHKNGNGSDSKDGNGSDSKSGNGSKNGGSDSKNNGSGSKDGKGNGGSNNGASKPSSAAPTKTLAPGSASLAAALAAQKSGQNAGFTLSSNALKAKFTAASDNNFGGKGSSSVKQDSLCLDKSQVNVASESKGNPAAGQANSATSKNNFINFCATKKVPLMNGLQQRVLSCNPIAMGMVVPIQQAPTVKWKVPTNNQVLPANKNITLELNVKNLQSGVFTDAQGTYFGAPADVNDKGIMIGHVHFVVNQVNGCQDTQPGDATKFVLFKGIDTAAVNGVLSFTANNGFPAGSYRACTITSAANHQPVLVSIAQRQNQDDCVCFQTK